MILQSWTHELCRSDSDGDGTANGVELGDPNCEWTPGTRARLPPPESHPGRYKMYTFCLFYICQTAITNHRTVGLFIWHFIKAFRSIVLHDFDVGLLVRRVRVFLIPETII